MSVALNSSRPSLPLQAMPGDKEIEVFRLGAFMHDTSRVPHRHKYDMVLWATKGTGVHVVDFKEYEMVPGRLFFIRAGQMHMVKEYAQEGWMILLKDLPIGRKLHGAELIQLGRDLPDACRGVFSMLEAELRYGAKHMEIIEPLLTAVLAGALRNSSQLTLVSDDWVTANELKQLIELSYKSGKDIYYYCETLDIGIRKLNGIAREFHGSTVYELLQNRLLEESQLLLTTTKKTVKGISYELGFEDPAYFCRWFRKLTGLPPLEYRRSCETAPECAGCET